MIKIQYCTCILFAIIFSANSPDEIPQILSEELTKRSYKIDTKIGYKFIVYLNCILNKAYYRITIAIDQ